jgi:uncharacterized membrane protein
MRKFITSALAAVTAAGAVAATAVPAEARDYYRHGGGHYYGHRHNGSNDAAVAAVAGIAGLAIGAAIAGNGSGRGYSSGRSGYSSGYSTGYSYDPRYDSYYGDYYEAPRYRERICISRERVWDPYIGRHVNIERRYPC